MRLLGFLQYGAILIGAIAMFAGHFFGTPKAFHLGLFLVGAGIGARGLEAVFTRQISPRLSVEGSGHHDGAPAVLWGILVLMVGTTIAGAAYLLAEGLGAAAVNRIARHPGTGLAALGAFFAGAGLLMILTAREPGSSARSRLAGIPRIVAGSGLALLGLTALGLGVWERLNPAAFERFLGAVAAALS